MAEIKYVEADKGEEIIEILKNLTKSLKT